jgi:hypothetical protein
MGVLDDAIREHLELKRKHGAPQGEVAQQEQEALGAPRGRAAEPAEAPAVEAEPVADAPAEAVEAAEPPAPEQAPDDEPDWDFEPKTAESEPPARGDTPPRGFEPVEEGEAAPAEDGEEEDVLEETPDFLQETPEHDRLWFEQKPPRDFDFD